MKSLSIILMIVCTFFTSVAQLLYKYGADQLSFSLSGILNVYIIGGLFLYGIGAVLFVTALRGGAVTVLFPIIATSYIWVAIGSMRFFGEVINSTRWLGILLIIVGIIVINVGDRDD